MREGIYMKSRLQIRHLTMGLAFILAFSAPLFASSKTFKNAYITFELPEKWKCNLDQTEWVCRSEDPVESKEAIIILTAKEVGPTDSFPLYESHLTNPISVQTKGGRTLTSKPQYKPKTDKFNDQQWIDGLHLESEVENFFTRYLATIKDRIAVLVTFSAHKLHYSKYSADFMKAIQSMRIHATRDLLAQSNSGIRPGGEMLGGSIQNAIPSDLVDQSMGVRKKSRNKMILVGVGVLALAAIAFLLLRKK